VCAGSFCCPCTAALLRVYLCSVGLRVPLLCLLCFPYASSSACFFLCTAVLPLRFSLVPMRCALVGVSFLFSSACLHVPVSTCVYSLWLFLFSLLLRVYWLSLCFPSYVCYLLFWYSLCQPLLVFCGYVGLVWASLCMVSVYLGCYVVLWVSVCGYFLVWGLLWVAYIWGAICFCVGFYC